jgi:hypothetical protein
MSGATISTIMIRNVVLPAGGMFLAITLLSGCGGDITAPLTTPDLGGNWLIAGTLPEISAPGFGYAVTLDVIDHQISASTSFGFRCSGDDSASTYAPLQAATIASDGSFQMESTDFPNTAPAIGLLLQGTAPTGAQSAWPGSFAFANAPAGCELPSSGNFTATPISQVTGTYSGSFTPGSLTNTPGTPLSVQVKLQQGGIFPGSTQYSLMVMSGSIEVEGSPCVSSGTSTSTPTSYNSIGGDFFSINFAMNDGSVWQTAGFIEDTGAQKLLLDPGIGISGGACQYSSSLSDVELTRQ